MMKLSVELLLLLLSMGLGVSDGTTGLLAPFIDFEVLVVAGGALVKSMGLSDVARTGFVDLEVVSGGLVQSMGLGVSDGTTGLSGVTAF